MRNTFFVAAAVFLVVVIAAYLQNSDVDKSESTVANKNFINSPSAPEKPFSSSAATFSVETESSSDTLGKTSLANTKVDAANVFVVDGVIMIDHSLRFYYEYFLTLQDELGLDKVRKLLTKDAQKRYEPLAAKYVIDLFQRYTDYLHDIRVLIEKEQKKSLLTATEQQTLAKELQVKIFKEIEIKVLFDDDFLAAYDDENTQQGAYDNYREMQKLHPDASIEVLRVENFGVEVAARFAALDEKRGQWKQRLNGYQCEKRAISESEGLHAMDKKQSIESLQQRLFSAPEIRRVKALEKHKLMEAADC